MTANFLRRLHWTLILTLSLTHAIAAQSPVVIRVDAGKSLGPLQRVWQYFGYDEPNYTYTAHGKELIGELAAMSPGNVEFRTHNLLTTGDGAASLKWGSTNAYTEGSDGRPVYDWTIVDRILDTYLHAGAKPFLEIGFMPQALSVHPEPYRHHWPKDELYSGWTYPPSDFKKWAELVHQLVVHCVAQYGKEEVRSWNWEVWNEPDIGYWHGSPEEYDKLYDFSVDAVRRALPGAHVGGPATTGPAAKKAAEFLRQFLEHCARGVNFATGEKGAPLDFISFHAKGSPQVENGHVRMGLAANLRDADEGFAIVSSFPEFATLPIILSESDPEGCAACSAHDHPQNAYRNGTLYPTYTAVSIRHMLDLSAQHKTHLEGFLTWAFEFEDQPYFYGFRDLATNGIDKPVLNLFRMLGLMTGDRVELRSSGAISSAEILKAGVRAAADIDGLAARSDHGVTVMVWNYHDNEEVSAPDMPVRLEISTLPTAARRMVLRHYRIDQRHSNAYTLWNEMGSPQNPTPEQYEKLKEAGQLQLLDSPQWVESKDGRLNLDFSLPRESVSLVELSW